MSTTAATYAGTVTRGSLLGRLIAPVIGLRDGYRETKALVAANLLTLNDGTLHMLGYRRSDLRRGIVRSARPD